MKFKRRSLSITKTIKYSINQAYRIIFMKFHECFFIIFGAFLHIFGVTELIRFCDTEKTQVKMTWFPRTYIQGETPRKVYQTLKKKKKKKKKKENPVALARPSTITCAGSS